MELSPGRIAISRLTGKVAIVFGAGPNIGGTIAHFLAREGARVVVCDIVPAAAEATVAFIAAHGGEALALAGSALDEAAVERVVARAVEHFGGGEADAGEDGGVLEGVEADLGLAELLDEVEEVFGEVGLEGDDELLIVQAEGVGRVEFNPREK